MKDCGACSVPTPSATNKKCRNILWIALVLNAIMFVAEMGASFKADSVSLQADAIDFLGDAANYGVSLFVLDVSVRARAYSSILKASTMGLFGLGVLAMAAYYFYVGATPEPKTMTTLGVLALVVNASVALMLFKFRDGDSNMKSVWICSRNDAIGNLLVIAAASGVFLTQTLWPDLIVASILAFLGISGSITILKKANSELKTNVIHV